MNLNRSFSFTNFLGGSSNDSSFVLVRIGIIERTKWASKQSVCMCVCAYLCVCTHECACACTCVNFTKLANVYVYMCMCAYMCMHVHVCAHTWMHMHVCVCLCIFLEPYISSTVQLSNFQHDNAPHPLPSLPQIHITTDLILSRGQISLQLFHSTPQFLHLCFILVCPSFGVLQLRHTLT